MLAWKKSMIIMLLQTIRSNHGLFGKIKAMKAILAVQTCNKIVEGSQLT